MKKKKIGNLLETMHLIENEELINKLKNIGSKEKKEILTKVGVLCTPIVIFSLISIITKNPMYLTGIAFGAAGIGFYTIVKDFIRDMKQMKRIYNNPGSLVNTPKKQNKQKRKSIDEIEKEYRTVKYSRLIQETNQSNNKIKTNIIPEIEIELDEESLEYIGNIITSLKKELDIYYSMYDLPPFIIKDEELEIVIEELQNAYKDKKIYNTLIELIKITLSNSMIESSEDISINELINSFKYKRNLELSELEIKALVYKIKHKIKEYKEERFNSYIKSIKNT